MTHKSCSPELSSQLGCNTGLRNSSHRPWSESPPPQIWGEAFKNLANFHFPRHMTFCLSLGTQSLSLPPGGRVSVQRKPPGNPLMLWVSFSYIAACLEMLVICVEWKWQEGPLGFALISRGSVASLVLAVGYCRHFSSAGNFHPSLNSLATETHTKKDI